MSRIPTVIEHPSGNGVVVGVNRKRIAEQPYFLLTNQPNNSVTVLANQASPMQVMTISGEGPAQIVSFAHQKTDVMRVFLQIQDGQVQRGLMNGAIHIDAIMGTGRQPYMLPEALYIDELRSLLVSFTDISTNANAVRIEALCSKFLEQQVDPTLARIRRRMEARQYISTPYWYTLDQGPVTVGAGATVTLPITVGQDHHFQLFQMSAVSTGLFNIDIVDTQKGESIITAPQNQNYAIGSELIVGNANFPFRFHEPVLVQVGQRLIVTLTDRTGAPNTVHLCLGGRALALRMWR